jgi:hypothetical protein
MGEPHAALRPLRRSDRDPAVFGGAAEVPGSRRRGRVAGSRETAAGGSWRQRVETYFDPAAVSTMRRAERATVTDGGRYPLSAITAACRWRCITRGNSQNAWLRQIHAHNYLFVNPLHARAHRASGSTPAAGAGSSRCTARGAACADYSEERTNRATVMDLEPRSASRAALAPVRGRERSRAKVSPESPVVDEIAAPTARCPFPNSTRSPPAVWYDVQWRHIQGGRKRARETWPQFDMVPAAPARTPVRSLWQAFRRRTRRMEK